MDLNKIVQEYRIERENASRNLAKLQEALKDVPVSFARLAEQLNRTYGKGIKPLPCVDITAELVDPQTQIYPISANLPVDAADAVVSELQLPYPRLRMSGEDERFYKEYRQLSEWIAPLDGATLLAEIRMAGLLFYRQGKLRYVEFLLEK